MTAKQIAEYLIKYLLNTSMSDAVAAFADAYPEVSSDDIGDGLLLARMQILSGAV